MKKIKSSMSISFAMPNTMTPILHVLELLKLLAENEDINTRVADSFSDTEAIAQSQLLITYTCDLRPSQEEQNALASFLDNGGRWFALHATNALLEFVDSGKVDTPDVAPDFMNLLGSRFVAHLRESEDRDQGDGRATSLDREYQRFRGGRRGALLLRAAG